jgi:hypothetical protein
MPTGLKKGLNRFLCVDGLDTHEHDARLRWALGLCLLAMALRVLYWCYTGRIWEDALITVLHSENFWRGHGLTHVRPGQAPLHGFTSPLSVLIPMMGDAIWVGLGIHFLKFVSIFAGGLTVLYVFAISIHPKIRIPTPAAVLAMGYVAVEHHQILWGMSGMETQVVTLVLIMSFYYLIAEKHKALGLSLGLCMLARPDFAFWTIIAGIYVLATQHRRFFLVVAVACAVYAPWILFTTFYYGSPVPNTVLAKSMGYYLWWAKPDLSYMEVKRQVVDSVMGTYQFHTLFQPLGPSYGGHGTHFRAIFEDRGIICNIMVCLAVLGSISAAVRKQFALWPIAAFTAVYAVYYIFFVPFIFGWYIVPFVAATMVLCARGLGALCTAAPSAKAQTAVMAMLVTAYLAGMAALLPLTFRTDRQIQVHIEDGQRKRMALYLNETTAADDWIGCEALGYVGYYSQRPVYDWPGLASRQVVQFWKDHPEERTMFDMFAHFMPEHIILRPNEKSRMPLEKQAWFADNYTVELSFVVPEKIKKSIFLYHCSQDTAFLLFKRKNTHVEEVD